VRHIASWQAFLLLGIGLEVFGLLLLLGYFRRQRWF
jgi:hypothetical protein